ncbi:MAG TPA: alkaline phosphatase family protein, partial [Anseongella sp.]|nr:alkaline phosphatase family protein [Anseongella sp.]
TGSVPAINGIAGNAWYDRSWGREIENVEDTTVSPVGAGGKGYSPRNLLTTTVGDELRIATNYQSRVVGVSIKNRGAILPAGHTANGAFWFDDSSKGFVTSTYYMNSLPAWASRFNQSRLIDSLMKDGWNTLYPIDTYVLSTADEKSYENTSGGEEKPIFPHQKASVTNTPYGNTMTLEFAKAAIEGYGLGGSGFTDMIAISLSSPDKIGHTYGPNSIEVEDNYLRMDKDLENFFNYLDGRFGRDGYLFFITADHGVGHSPGYLQENRIPGGLIVEVNMAELEAGLRKKFGAQGLILAVTNGQVYLNNEVLSQQGLEKRAVAAYIAEQLKQVDGIWDAVPSKELGTATLPETIKSMFINGIHPQRSGDIVLIRSAGWKGGSLRGASHGD